MTSNAAAPKLSVRILADFDDPALDPACWDRLLTAGPSNLPCLMLDWQRAWWHAYGGDRLLLALAEEGGATRAIAPLYADEEMLYLVGSGEADALDFIGHIDERSLSQMIAAARDELSAFAGMHLYHMPSDSRTTTVLAGVAARLGLELCTLYELGAPYLDLTDSAHAEQVIERRKVRKEEYRMMREGPLEVRLATREDLDPWLDRLFAQHVARWTGQGDTKFDEQTRREFCRAIVHSGHDAGWLRFTMLEWKGQPASFDITLVRGDRHLGFLVSRDPAITRHSPGKVLEAHVIRAALESGARRYEFGIGDQEYKLSRSSANPRVVSWALWPQ
jgi:CelD/BcsL family acetyltransferase involved in cellulose biosynthesis